MVLCSLALIFGLTFTVGFLVKLYFVHTTKWCTNKVCLNGKTVIVTGANTGIGFHSALAFAMRGARVILGCRDQAKAETARLEIIRQTENEDIVVKLLDFSSLKSVRDFVQEIKDGETKVDILVNNAGTGGLAEKITHDGLQNTMQVNYFGPVLLTLLLTDIMKKASKARIINVSSMLAAKAKLDPQNLNEYRGPLGSYMNSKLGNVLFTKELAKKLKGTNVTVYSLHPGAVATEIFRKFSGWRRTIYEIISYIYFKSAEEGAQTTIYTATEQNLEEYSGRHFEECQVVTDYESANNEKLAQDVWERTLEHLNINLEI